MKIAVIIDTWFPFVGGGQINAWEISKIIAAKGNKVDIITRDNGKTNKLKSKNLNVIQLGGQTNTNDSLSQIIFCLKAIPYIAKKDYDVVHGHAFWPGITLFVLKLLKKSSTVYTVHGTSINSKLKGFIPKAIETILLTKIPYNQVITVSRDFMKIPNVNQDVEFIPNAPNIKKFEKIRIAKSKTLQLIYVGRLHKQKNLTNLIVAFSQAKKEIGNIKLLIVGDGPQKEELKILIDKLKLKKHIILTGELFGDELVRKFKASTLFILPSVYEGQSLSLLEAFAAKIPPIVSAVGDSGYLVKEGKNGFVIKNPSDINEIRQAILRAFNSKKLDNIADLNYKYLKNNISWERSAQKTLEKYKKIVNVFGK